MATPSQIAANRENAKKSTGPVTPEGKAKSSRNALSHGFEAATFFMEDENPEEFHALMLDLQNEYQPATPTEQILVEKMFHHQLLGLRAMRLQSDCLAGLEFGDGIPKDLGLLIRYHTAADRGFHKAHAELVKAQKERKMSEIGFVPENSGAVSAIPAESAQIPPDSPQNPHDPLQNPAASEKIAAFEAAIAAAEAEMAAGEADMAACEAAIAAAEAELAATGAELPQAA